MECKNCPENMVKSMIVYPLCDNNGENPCSGPDPVYGVLYKVRFKRVKSQWHITIPLCRNNAPSENLTTNIIPHLQFSTLLL